MRNLWKCVGPGHWQSAYWDVLWDDSRGAWTVTHVMGERAMEETFPSERSAMEFCDQQMRVEKLF